MARLGGSIARRYAKALFEKICGARLTYSYIRIGGLREDLADGFIDAVRDDHHRDHERGEDEQADEEGVAGTPREQDGDGEQAEIEPGVVGRHAGFDAHDHPCDGRAHRGPGGSAHSRR